MTESNEIPEGVTPAQVCRTALLVIGVPKHIVDELRVGPQMDGWVQLVVMQKMPWQQVRAIYERATEKVLKEHPEFLDG